MSNNLIKYFFASKIINGPVLGHICAVYFYLTSSSLKQGPGAQT